MIPTYMMQIEEIPVTRNGKLDKRALPDIVQESGEEYIAPRNEIEKIIVRIFEEVVGGNKISVDDDFFEVGGHSLRATKVVNRIEVETGVRIPIKIIFSERTAEAIARYIEESENKEYESIPKAEEKEYYPMSSSQKRMYLIWQMKKESIVYNMPACYKLEGRVRVDDIKNSLQEMIKRHEILRTRFLTRDGDLVQKVLDKVEVDYSYEESMDEVSEVFKNFIKPFNLDEGNLIRMKVVKSKKEYYLLIDMHHIISDGMSMGIFIKEFSTFYNGGNLEKLNLQYKDYSEWMRKRSFDSEKSYWLSQFEEEVPVIDLPYDYKRPLEKSYKGAITSIELQKEIKSGIKELCNITGATEYMIFLSAFMVVLNKYTRQEDIVVGTPISGRTNKDMESMMGMFINTLAMREKPEAGKSFIKFVGEVKESCLKAYENQEYPFEELVESVEVRRDFSRNPLFDVMFSLQNNEKVNLSMDNLMIDQIWGEHRISKFDLSIMMESREDKYFVGAEYSTTLFKRETINRFLAHFKEVLCKVIYNPESLIGEIEVVTKEEKDLILNKFNDTYVEYDKEKTVVDMFEKQVRKNPSKIAVIYEKEKLTYKELNEKSNILAQKLRDMGIKPDDFVAISAERSLEMVIGILAIIKAGGAYVPIDPKYPEKRINYILSDCKPKALLTYKTDVQAKEIPTIDLSNNKSFEGELKKLEKVNRPDDLLYLIYTSGTTGKPKGVMVKHSNMVNYCYNNEKSTAAGVFNRKLNNMGSVTNMSFDIFGTEIILVFANGMTTFIANSDEQEEVEYLSSFIERNSIEILQTTPSRIKILLSQPEKLKRLNSLKYIMVGGEKVESDIVNKLHQYTNAIVENVYGPSETTIWSTANELSRNISENDISIGQPIANTQIYILQGLNLCGIGVPGELCIAGDGVAKGYLNKPELTAEKFINNPYGEGKLYRTGDLAKWLPDGNIEYLGRMDEQVKIRGFRIELEEIAKVLCKIDYINDVAVTVRENVSSEKAIYSYIVSNINVDINKIKEEIRKELPEYMIPAYMMQIENIPVNRNGKLDKRALPDIVQESKEEYIAPRNEKEKIICSIFAEVLEVKKIGLQDNFFELGGDSMKLLRLISSLRKEGFNVTFNIIKRSNTVKMLAENLCTISDEYGGEKIKNENQILINKINVPKEMKEDFINSNVYEELNKYNRNIENAVKSREYVPLKVQQDFLNKNTPFISALGIEIIGEVSKEQILNAIKNIINAQAALRTIYNSKDNVLIEVSKRDWYIPYFNKSEYDEVYNNIGGIFECKELFETSKLLSKVITIEKDNNHHLIFFYVNHVLWDFFTSQVLLDMVKNTLLNYKNSFVPEETYYEYVNRKRNNSKSVEIYDSIENIEHNVENYMKKIKNNYDYVYKVLITRQINQLEKKEILESPIKWILDKYYKIINIKEITQIPFTMIYHARETKTLNTLGLYADTIPCLYDINTGKVQGWGKQEKMNINSSESYELYKEKVPTESNIFKQLSINVITEDSNTYYNNCKNNTVKVIGRYGVDEIPEEISMYIGKNVLEIQCLVYTKREVKRENIVNNIKEIFGIV
ncbi:amino acid adenylation domain-containing protein [Clostridium sp. MB40-C1]|uniref:non-ribosomal peptide synthetase n=2 Tax=Clostridium sp. MB40-C1 TaxID=3070996 RepID=UPI0027E0B28F|nr:non-ribosomal peptide synthetase [Clostridium sp. MB40-C1]WMJ80655.1 amino acid adenylation domain-containing protein [Clostridium sp. MB40-C1]